MDYTLYECLCMELQAGSLWEYAHSKKYKKSFFQNSFGFVCDVFKLCGNDPISWMAWVVGLGWIRKHATPG
jgi:hypothetical protein